MENVSRGGGGGKIGFFKKKTHLVYPQYLNGDSDLLLDNEFDWLGALRNLGGGVRPVLI